MPKESVFKVHPAVGRMRVPLMAAVAMGAMALALPARNAIADPNAIADAAARVPIVLHAAHLLDIDAGRLVTPGEVLVEGERIRAVGSSVTHPAGVLFNDLGATTLLPGLIDAHVHLFLHPGAEDLQ